MSFIPFLKLPLYTAGISHIYIFLINYSNTISLKMLENLDQQSSKIRTLLEQADNFTIKPKH